MTPEPLRTVAENRAALIEITELMARDPASGTPAHDRLNALVNLVQDFEARRYSLEPATLKVVK